MRPDRDLVVSNTLLLDNYQARHTSVLNEVGIHIEL
jgi:hypothetical protein